MRSDYWREAFSCAAEACGLSVSVETVNNIGDALAMSAEMEAETTGRLCIPNPLRAELEASERRRAREVHELEREAEILRKFIEALYRNQVFAIVRDGGVNLERRR